jgi:hypothetical protein
MVKGLVVVAVIVVVVVVVNAVNAQSPMVKQRLLSLLQKHLHSLAHQWEWVEHPLPCLFRILLRVLAIRRLLYPKPVKKQGKEPPVSQENLESKGLRVKVIAQLATLQNLHLRLQLLQHQRLR